MSAWLSILGTAIKVILVYFKVKPPKPGPDVDPIKLPTIRPPAPKK